MNKGKALAIFKDIENEKYNDGEKMTAIKVILNFETINSITKREIFTVLKWLFSDDDLPEVEV